MSLEITAIPNTNDVRKELEKAIDKEGFNALVMVGFGIRPREALVTGAAIGYKLAIDCFSKQLEQIALAIPKGTPK